MVGVSIRSTGNGGVGPWLAERIDGSVPSRSARSGLRPVSIGSPIDWLDRSVLVEPNVGGREREQGVKGNERVPAIGRPVARARRVPDRVTPISATAALPSGRRQHRVGAVKPSEANGRHPTV